MGTSRKLCHLHAFANFGTSETLSWDVRTKHVTFDSIPTLEHIRGVAVYGPGATLFTLGPNGTVQQFDLNSPSIMVANVQHPVSLLPPSPPNSEETAERSIHSATTIHTSESDASSIPLEMSVSESDEDHLSPLARITRRQAQDSGNETYESASPVSSRSGLSSLSKSSAGSRTPGRHGGSMRSRGMSEHTYISSGTTVQSSTVGKREPDNYSMGYSFGTTSVPSMTSSRSRQRPSRLRHEVPRSPDDNKVHELFKYTRTRLSDIPYKHPMNADNSRLTNDDLRRQMLSTIFGWHQEVEDLIRDEMSRHPTGSACRILLAKWLGDVETDIMAAGAQNMTSSDWMLLALSGIGEQASQQKLGRVYIQRLLESGDVHVAVTIMLGMGDHTDAIEIYISHKRYMEALILTCLTFPAVWERQVAIIRKWGEWAVQHGQQQLAIRCFACTGQESTEPWRSPSAVQLNFQSVTPSIPELLSPPLSPPGVQRGPQRSIAKTSALKLITSFGDPSKKSKFYSQADGGQTPIAAGVTPIAESAISPGGSYEAATAFLRPSNNSRFNTPTSARPGTSGRNRLPSIGEVPSDLNREALTQAADKNSARRHARMTSDQDNLSAGLSLQRAATASPMMMRDQYSRVVTGYEGERPPSPDNDILARMQEAKVNHRNGSRDRIPRGINLEVRTLEQQSNAMDAASPEQSVTSSTRFHWPSRRRGPGSVASSITSNSSAGRSYRNGRQQRDDYIHSLEAAKHYNKRNRSRNGSQERTRDGSRERHGSRERRERSRDRSEDRGRASARSWTKPKRSPTSPIPMSPEDIANLSTPKVLEGVDPSTVRKSSKAKTKPSSRTSSRGSKGAKSVDGRRRATTGDGRDRSRGRDGSQIRSPSSPVPLTANSLQLQGSEDEADLKHAMLAQEAFRAKHSRSTSQALTSPAVSVGRREKSETRHGDANEPREAVIPLMTRSRAASTDHAGDLRQIKDDRQKKKDQAARELEERRKSLAKRSHTPQIPHPDGYMSIPEHVAVEAPEERPPPEDIPPRSATEPPKTMYARNGGPHIGLPATPKAMRLILSSDKFGGEAPVPEVPEAFQQSHTAEDIETPLQEAAPKDDGGLLTLLPSTVYQPPSRPMIPRSMSAPIPDDPPQKPKFRRKMSNGAGASIDEVVQSQPGHSMPPPPPPPPSAPPMLKELQHLATPPPPPPAPLPYARHLASGGGALGSGMIEIVMDDDDTPMTAAPNDGMVPVLPPPAPPSRGHNRGRSVGDGSFSGRLSKAAERMRSGSRGRKESRPRMASVDASYDGSSQVMSPVLAPPPVLYDQDAIRSPIDAKGKHLSTGLHRSELI